MGAIEIDPFDVEDQANASSVRSNCREDRQRRLAGIGEWVRGHDLDAWSATLLAAIERASTMRR